MSIVLSSVVVPAVHLVMSSHSLKLVINTPSCADNKYFHSHSGENFITQISLWIDVAQYNSWNNFNVFRTKLLQLNKNVNVSE